MVFRVSRALVSPLALILLTTLLHSGCTGEPADTRQTETAVSTYSMEQLLGNRSLSNGSLSHDEKRVLYSSDEAGVFNAYTVPVTGGEATQVTRSTDTGIYAVSFFPEDDRFLYRQEVGGKGLWHLFVQNPDGSSKDVTPVDGARFQFQGWSPKGDGFYFTSNQRNPERRDVYKMDLETFKPSLLFENDGKLVFRAISPDERHLVFNEIVSDREARIHLYTQGTETPRQLLANAEPANRYPLFFRSDQLYYLSDTDSEFLHLRRLNPGSGSSEPVWKAEWDVTDAELVPSSQQIVVTINRDAQIDLELVDPGSGTAQRLPGIPPGDCGPLAFSAGGGMMVFNVNTATSPTELFVYDFAAGQAQSITSALNPEVKQQDLVEPRVVRFGSFDGLEVPAIYYHPKQASGPVPALVWAHSLPGGQFRIQYSAPVQFLVNRGYAVLAPNYRGSAGYGKSYLSLDDRRHGEADLADLVAARKYLGSLPAIDSGRVGVIGPSYGGYLALAALTFEPEQFAAGVDLFGTVDWVRTLSNLPDWWAPFQESLYREFGDPVEDQKLLRSVSPAFHTDNINKPLLVVHGGQDWWVSTEESRALVDEVQEQGVPAQLLLFDDEGHGFGKQSNQAAAYTSIVEFLDQHLATPGDIETASLGTQGAR